MFSRTIFLYEETSYAGTRQGRDGTLPRKGMTRTPLGLKVGIHKNPIIIGCKATSFVQPSKALCTCGQHEVIRISNDQVAHKSTGGTGTDFERVRTL